MGGVQLKASTPYAMVYRNVHSDPVHNFSSTNSLTVKESEAGPNGRNNLDPNAPGAIAGLDPREAVAWSTNDGASWTWGRQVGPCYGSTTTDDGTRLPHYAWQSSPTGKPKSNQPYSSYWGPARLHADLALGAAPHHVHEAGGYAPVGKSVGVVTVRNLRTGQTGHTAALGSGIRRARSTRPSPSRSVTATRSPTPAPSTRAKPTATSSPSSVSAAAPFPSPPPATAPTAPNSSPSTPLRGPQLGRTRPPPARPPARVRVRAGRDADQHAEPAHPRPPPASASLQQPGSRTSHARVDWAASARVARPRPTAGSRSGAPPGGARPRRGGRHHRHPSGFDSTVRASSPPPTSPSRRRRRLNRCAPAIAALETGRPASAGFDGSSRPYVSRQGRRQALGVRAGQAVQIQFRRAGACTPPLSSHQARRALLGASPLGHPAEARAGTGEGARCGRLAWRVCATGPARRLPLRVVHPSRWPAGRGERGRPLSRTGRSPTRDAPGVVRLAEGVGGLCLCVLRVVVVGCGCWFVWWLCCVGCWWWLVVLGRGGRFRWGWRRPMIRICVLRSGCMRSGLCLSGIRRCFVSLAR